MITRFAKLLALALPLMAAGCLNNEITGTRDLTFTMTADAETATVDQVVTFLYSATGTSLTSVVVDFGDDEEIARGYFGAVEITDFVEHAFTAAGTYTVVAAATAENGVATDSVTVVVS